jgi:hypothetical protein
VGENPHGEGGKTSSTSDASAANNAWLSPIEIASHEVWNDSKNLPKTAFDT